jgi:hypothetical protein
MFSIVPTNLMAIFVTVLGSRNQKNNQNFTWVPANQILSKKSKILEFGKAKFTVEHI